MKNLLIAIFLTVFLIFFFGSCGGGNNGNHGKNNNHKNGGKTVTDKVPDKDPELDTPDSMPDLTPYKNWYFKKFIKLGDVTGVLVKRPKGDPPVDADGNPLLDKDGNPILVEDAFELNISFELDNQGDEYIEHIQFWISYLDKDGKEIEDAGMQCTWDKIKAKTKLRLPFQDTTPPEGFEPGKFKAKLVGLILGEPKE